MLLSVVLSLSSLFLAVDGQLSSQAVFSSPWNGEEHVITPRFSEFVEGLLNASNIHGLSLAIIRKDGEPEFGAWGSRTEEGDPTTPNTLFHIASCSKAFLTSAFGILMEDFASGKNTTALSPGLTSFDFNTKVKDIMPAGSDWNLMDDWAYEKANIRDILSHVSGLPRHDFSIGPEDGLKDVVSRMKFLRPAFELRQQWAYNNLMYMLSSYLISHYTGSYTSFVKDRIFTPLGMNSTTFSPSRAVCSGEMTHAWTKSGRRIPQPFTDELIELTSGPGGIISSGKDMAKWVKALLNSGVDASTNNTIIPRSVIDEVTTAHAIVEGKPGIPSQSISGYGMGWVRMSYRGHDVVQHSGGIPGSSSLVTFLPSDALGVIVLINADNQAPASVAITDRIIDDMLGLNNIKHDSLLQESAPSLQHGQEPSDVTAETPIELDKYAGTYSNAGYGSVTLCDSSNSLNSSYCAQVLSDFAIVDSHKPNQLTSSLLAKPQLFAKWSRLWSTHVRLIHLSDSKSVNIQITTLFTDGFGVDKTPFETFENGEGEVVAEFVVEDGRVLGLGVFGIPGDLTKRRGDTVQARAEVWFDKISDHACIHCWN